MKTRSARSSGEVRSTEIVSSEPNSAAIGTVIRPETVRRFARQAGFSEVTVLPVEHDFWRFYRLNP